MRPEPTWRPCLPDTAWLTMFPLVGSCIIAPLHKDGMHVFLYLFPTSMLYCLGGEWLHVCAVLYGPPLLDRLSCGAHTVRTVKLL
mgnify:CR=1 FL=1